MLIAEIRRKLADLEDVDPEEGDVVQRLRAILRETKEDLLTADVFGVLKYLPRVPYLQSFLQAIADRNPDCIEFGKSIQTDGRAIEFCDFKFWPSYPTPKGMPGSTTEPDVQISTPNLLMFFEAKLNSGFGQHQIERELTAGLDQAGKKEFFLVLVTPSILPPRMSFEGRRLRLRDYLNSASATPEISENVANRIKANRYRVLWITWHAIVAALNSAYINHRISAVEGSDETLRVGDMIGDLNELMEMRGLRPFRGFSGILKTDTSSWCRMCLVPGVSPIRRYRGIELSAVIKQFSYTINVSKWLPFRSPDKDEKLNLSEIVGRQDLAGKLDQLFPWGTKQ